ncbi:hypothetical protein O0I10_003489 [Lichtheimia ornata]|uniref:Uncharacterized protein n=1 Tax=Lichtheimia ornata TaxID=688661 RepID=A0AAD7Y005_9FUNG|nr:uncharacterized protein O0I10_003489 [Lichtheimia ornata]KAJ8660845.1 hypothetical protein O0I10_003489 [Lichtheimia ornata]
MSSTRKTSRRATLGTTDNKKNVAIAATPRRYSSYLHNDNKDPKETPIATTTTTATTTSVHRKRSNTTTNRRSSVTALTASARAKLVNKYNNHEEKTTAADTSDISGGGNGSHHNTNNRRLSINKRSSTRLPRCVTNNQPEPNMKECAQKQQPTIDIDQLTALLLKTETHHGEQGQDMDERARRRRSMPPLQQQQENGGDDEFWKELVDIKSRLQRLEINKHHVVDDKSCSSSTTTASSIHTPPAMPSSPRVTVHQKRLQDALALLEQQQPGPLAKSMSVVVNETIAMNQKLWAAIPHDLNTDARSLVAMQKSSDIQLRELTESLYLMATTCTSNNNNMPSPLAESSSPPIMMMPSPQQQPHGPSSLPVSPRRAAPPQPPSFEESYYYRRPTMSAYQYKQQQQQQQQPSSLPALHHQHRASLSIAASRPQIKAAGILDYSPTTDYFSARHKYYEPRYSGSHLIHEA